MFTQLKKILKYIFVSNCSLGKKEFFITKMLYFSLLMKLPKFISKKLLNVNKKCLPDFSRISDDSFIHRFYQSNDQLSKEGIKYFNDLKNKNCTTIEARLLKSEGYVNLSNTFSLEKNFIENFKSQLNKNHAFNSHRPIHSDLKKKKPNDNYNYWSYLPDEKNLINFYGHILQNSKLKLILEDYFKFKPDLYSICTMLSKPSDKLNAVTNLHRDYDDENFLVLFIYWTDVSENNGATYFLKQSHFKEDIDNKNGIYLDGKAGSVYLANTFALHSGNKNLKNDRVVTWFRFGKRPNLVNFVDKDYLFNNLYEEMY